MTKISWCVTSNQPPIPCFKPRKTWGLLTNHRLFLYVALAFSTFASLWMFLTEFPLICRSLFRYCGARAKFLTLKNTVIVFIYTAQIDSIREHGSTHTVSRLKCVFFTISSWFENHQPQKTKISTVIYAPFIQNSNEMASRLTVTTSFPRVFFQLL